MVLLLFTVFVAAICIGPVSLSLHEVAASLLAGLRGQGPDSPVSAIVWNTRLPRILMAVVAGAVLAVAGTVFQTATGNSLADPYLLGINSGAATGVALVVLVIGSGSALVFSAGALLGALTAVVLVLLLAGSASTRGPFRLILAGLAVGYALNAVSSFLIFISDSPEASRSVMFWLLGSLASVQPTSLVTGSAAAIVTLALLVLKAPALDALASGDDSARASGFHPERLRFALLAGVSAAVGVVVAGVGGIGFIGLVIPHVARRLVGHGHRLLLPAAALLGALLLIVSDTIARTAFAPQEIPVGVITGILGAPVLLLLLRASANHPYTR